jgi:hypothetical protein
MYKRRACPRVDLLVVLACLCGCQKHATVTSASPTRPSTLVTNSGSHQKGIPAQGPCSGPPPPMGRGGPPPAFSRERRALTARFDRDKNLRLSLAERNEARAWLKSEGTKPGPPGAGELGPPKMGPPPGMPRQPPAKKGPYPKHSDFPRYPSAPLFDKDTLRTLLLTFERPEWEDELEDFYDTDVEVPASLEVDGKHYEDVGMRFRGMSSFAMVEKGYKRPLNLSMDAFTPGQTLYGAKSLNLLNSAHDPTFLRSVLFLSTARTFLPAPDANFVRVVINGEYFGVYVNAQQFDANFTEQWFKSRVGHRFKVPGGPMGRGSLAYLGDEPKAYEKIYTYKGTDPANGYQSLITLCRVLTQTPLESLEQALVPIMDVDEVLTYLALDNVFLNSDGYLVRTSDYNLYQKPNGQFVLIPHDANETFDALDQGPGQERRIDVDPLFGANAPNKPLLSRLLAVPRLKQRYLELVRTIATQGLDRARLFSQVQTYQSLLTEAVRTDNKKLFDLDSFLRGPTENLEHDGPCGKEVNYGILPFADARQAFLLNHPAITSLSAK